MFEDTIVPAGGQHWGYSPTSVCWGEAHVLAAASCSRRFAKAGGWALSLLQRHAVECNKHAVECNKYPELCSHG